MSEVLVGLVPWSLSGDLRDQRLYALSLLCLGAGTLMCLAALRVVVLDVLAVAVAAGGAAAWLLSTGPREGRTLLVVLPGNGLTLADLAVLALRNRRWDVPAAALAAAGALGWSFTRGSYDGPGLAVVVEGEALSLGDLLWLPAVLLTLWLSWRGARR